jgi:integrase
MKAFKLLKTDYLKVQEENSGKPKRLFFDFVESYLDRCHRSDRYKLMYHNTMNHILNFCSFQDIEQPYTNEIDMEFCENFVFYLKSEKRLMQNTVKGHLERLHAMLHKAVLYGYPVNNTYEEMSVTEEEVGSVFLTMTEITRIYYYENLTRFQKEVRDHFVIGCMTGLRYSDYSRLNESNFISDSNQIRIKTKKTGAVVFVPMHKFVREILKKYNYNLPKPRCIQYFNICIKDICRKVGLNEPILWERTVGTEVITKEVPKWQMIASHTARRSFATNMFLQNIPAYRIMLITGHKSEKSFFKYIRVTREENATALSGHLFF